MDGAGVAARRVFSGTDALRRRVDDGGARAGLQGADALAGLDRLGHSGSRSSRTSWRRFSTGRRPGSSPIRPRSDKLIEKLNLDVDGRLGDRQSLNVRVHQRRRSLAASLTPAWQRSSDSRSRPPATTQEAAASPVVATCSLTRGLNTELRRISSAIASCWARCRASSAARWRRARGRRIGTGPVDHARPRTGVLRRRNQARARQLPAGLRL